jgi:uncharacterized membrane protein
VAAPVAVAPPPVQAGHRLRVRWPHYSAAGTFGALVFGCASFTPSLVPREWFVQGIVNGLSAAVGYGVAVFLAWLIRAVTGWTPSAIVVRRAWIALACLGIPLIAWSLFLGQRWQREIHLLTDVAPPDSYSWVRIVLLALTILVALIAVGRGFRWMVRWLTKRLVSWVPDRLAGPLSVVIVILVLVGLNEGLLFRGLTTAANSAFGTVNGTTNEGTFRPLAPERSGSPESLISWESLGRQGRDFVGLGPSIADLASFSGVPAMQPVRVYAGLRSADSTRARAALAVRDLRRAGGFDRAVLVVATTTGTGLVDPAAAEGIEYMYNGDSAIVGMQYSYLPSWISFLVDREIAEEAGRELFNQVYDAWSALPRERRPELLVTGTSMGVYGSEAAFSGDADLRKRTDGVVWAGPTSFSVLHERFVGQRDPGSPEWLPVYDSGRTVRFMSRPKDVWAPGMPWHRPRVVYLQNGTDPVVYWSPQLIFDRPDWLEGPPAPDVSPDMFWIPVVTFWQVTADLPSTYDVPAGHGHRYAELYADGWAAVVPPQGWTAQDTQRLRDLLRRHAIARAKAEEALAAGR